MKLPHKIPTMPTGRLLRLARIVVSLVVLLAASLLFSTLSFRLTAALGWASRIQILPMAFASCIGVLGLWLVITLVFGRLYCSTACPLGTLQDIIARIAHRNPYHFAPPLNPLRYIALVVFLLFTAIGVTRLPAMVDPYQAFERMVVSFLRPALEFIGGKEVIAVSAYSFVMSVFTLGALAIAAALRGRIFCNSLCPVGAGLSLFSRFSIFQFDIDTDVCTNCRRCEYVCKSQCINLNDHVVDPSRCVVCFNCIDSCPTKAIRYTTRHKQLSLPLLQRLPSPTLTPLSPSPSPSPSPQKTFKADAGKSTLLKQPEDA